MDNKTENKIAHLGFIETTIEEWQIILHQLKAGRWELLRRYWESESLVEKTSILID